MFALKSLRVALTGCAFGLGLSSAAMATPLLQLGPGDPSDPGWNYVGGGNDTWIYSGMSAVLNAYALDKIGDTGGNTWDTAGGTDRYAYLVIAATPTGSGAGPTDVLDVTVMNDGAVVSLYDSGFGTPPVEDDNDISGHGIYDTYFEIYRFDFDGSVVDIPNVEPGNGDGLKDGYLEALNISWNSNAAGLDGIHFDLFTVKGDGTYTKGAIPVRDLVHAIAPYSHDAEFHRVPEPAPLGMLGAGFLALCWTRRRRMNG